MVDLKAKPFNLNDEDIQWVNETLKSLSDTEKIGQLFCTLGFTTDEKDLLALTKQIGIGGIMYRPSEGKEVQRIHKFIQDNSKVPVFTAANLESGGNGVASNGTNFGKPMQVAATNDFEMGYKLGKVACSEGAAVGCNWSFAPIVDIDMNFRNPITNLRTFGDDPDKIISYAKGYMKAADESGVAVSIKHFPGDGVDERDQHLLTSVNSLSTDDWDKTYGKIYKELIDEGAKTVMVAHISQPAYSKKINPNLKDSDVLPASLSKELLQILLREKLKFNGLIITDATLMLGFTTAMKREDAVPYSIAAGNDMFLFTKNLEEDFGFMVSGYKKGVITEERLNEAVIRILATKASLKLHKKKENNTLVPNEDALKILKSKEHVEWAKECADKSVTLVKDVQNILPISPKKFKRVYLNVLEESDNIDTPLKNKLKEKLEKEGFEVIVRNRDTEIDMTELATGNLNQRTLELMEELQEKSSDFASRYDLVLYVSNFETASNNTTIRIRWAGIMGMGNDSPWFVNEIPTMFISLANPYHLLDVPMIKTFINAYTNNEYVLDAVIEKIMGRSEFKGVSPINPFCERNDTKY